MYIEIPLDWYECMKMSLQLMLEDIIEYNRLRKKAIDGYVDMEFRKGIYALPQAGILANNFSETLFCMP
jgi:hypothetical protein